MKFFRLDLLTLLISLFILNSCKNQDAVGLGVQSANQLNGSLVQETNLITNTVPEDSVITSGALPKNPLAYFNDPILGLTVSNLATDLNLPGTSAYTLPVGTVYIDSVRLVLHYAPGFYGDSLSSIYKANVYQLASRYNTDTTYYSTKKFAYLPTLLGSTSFTARPHDSVKIFNIIAGAPDTLYKVAPEIRIPISASFINQNFFNASSTSLNSNVIFNNNIHGLYITLTGTSGAGGIIMIQPTDTLAVYYRSVQGTTIDTAQAYLPISNMAASITHTYSTAVQTELNNTSSSRGVIYLQGLAGLRAKVGFANALKDLTTKAGNNIILNRAELVITVSPTTNVPYAAIPQLTMYTLDLAGQRSQIQDSNSADPRSQGLTVFGGYYNAADRNYHFVLTGFLQDLLLGKTVDNGTYIAPIDTSSTTTVIAPTAQVASRTVAVGGNLPSNSPNVPYKMTLNIIYTKIKN